MKSSLNKELLAREKGLLRAILKLKTVEGCQRFFEDLCTPNELQEMADRWLVAQMINKKLPYRKIQEATGVSTTTITRVARCLTYGAGYRSLLQNPKEASK